MNNYSIMFALTLLLFGAAQAQQQQQQPLVVYVLDEQCDELARELISELDQDLLYNEAVDKSGVERRAPLISVLLVARREFTRSRLFVEARRSSESSLATLAVNCAHRDRVALAFAEYRASVDCLVPLLDAELERAEAFPESRVRTLALGLERLALRAPAWSRRRLCSVTSLDTLASLSRVSMLALAIVVVYALRARRQLTRQWLARLVQCTRPRQSAA